MTFLGKFARRLRAFGHREDGAIAVQFAFLALPVAVLAFGMVDVNRASVAKKDLQDALDAATLLAGRSSAVTDTALQAIGAAALAGQMSGMTDATLVSSTFTISGSNITSSAKVKLTPIVANLWLNQDMEVGASSQIIRSVNKLEVALVLDNTGSMAGTKLTNLKSAATDFIDQLGAAAARSTEVNPVKIGIVPFSNAVRLTATTSELNTYKAAAWMDAAGNNTASRQIFNGDVQNRFSLFTTLNQPWAGCVESRVAPYDVQETASSASVPDTLYTPYFYPDAADDNGSGIGTGYDSNNYLKDSKLYSTYTSANVTSANAAAKMNGLLTNSNLSTNDKYMILAQGNKAKYNKTISVAGPNTGCTMQPISRLSTDWTALKAKITAMNAVGETHIPLGMAWGWNVLSPYGPFSDGVTYSTPKTTKVVVLMTDGDNTYTDNGNYNGSAYDGYGYIWQNRTGTVGSARTAAIDSRLTTICTNMKAAGIVIYTVRVEVTTGSSALLEGCASTPDKFYDVQSASNLTAVFSAIAGSIENLRITQ
jgi:Flp pilus assembly protein TadG